MLDKKHILNRFIGYVKIDTESDPNSMSTPSTEKQWDLANKLADELKTIGMQDVSIDDNAYIMATLPSNVSHKVPTIGFVSHFDTSPDFTAKNVNPQIIENYDGSDIVLNKKEEHCIISLIILKICYSIKGKLSSLQMALRFWVLMIKQGFVKL